jgi:hypothetical protein
VCHYPGCTRPSRPDPATGRPSLYCEESDPSGGPVHNRANAWRRRRAEKAGNPLEGHGVSAPVSLARAALEQRVAEVPGKLAELRDFLDRLAPTWLLRVIWRPPAPRLKTPTARR